MHPEGENRNRHCLGIHMEKMKPICMGLVGPKIENVDLARDFKVCYTFQSNSFGGTRGPKVGLVGAELLEVIY